MKYKLASKAQDKISVWVECILKYNVYLTIQVQSFTILIGVDASIKSIKYNTKSHILKQVGTTKLGLDAA